MAQNPYEAPSAAVDDPAVAMAPRPPQVTLAIRILWITFGVSLITMHPSIRGDWWNMPGTASATESGLMAGVVVASLIFSAIGATLIWLTGRGRNWARWALLALLIIGWLVTISDFSRSIVETPIAAIADVLIAAAELWACYLLFQGAGAAWFSRGKRAP
jgi:hypothetical protein